LGPRFAGSSIDAGGGDGERDARRTRVDAIGDDLGEYCLVEVAGIGIGEVLEEMKKVDARFAHRGTGRARQSMARAPAMR
jgi:hypothetical protein